jgi:hypothetical protein
MSKNITQKHSDAQIVAVVGMLIADGHSKYLPRIKADDFSGRIVIQGKAYRVKLRWPDGSEVHEVSPEIRPLGDTNDNDSVDLESISGFYF